MLMPLLCLDRIAWNIILRNFASYFFSQSAMLALDIAFHQAEKPTSRRVTWILTPLLNFDSYSVEI